MAITNFIPELWSAAVQVPRENALVYGQPQCVNRDYEGEIRQQGDKVHVTSINSVTIRPYNKNTDLTTEDVGDAGADLEVNLADYFSFRVNDVDRVQAAGDFQSPATRNAGHGMALQIDAAVSAAMAAGVHSDNKIGSKTITYSQRSDADKAYDVLVDLATRLNRKNAPTAGRFVVVTADMYGLLNKSSMFTDVSAAGSTETLRNGMVGRAAGFDVLLSNAAPPYTRTVTDAVTLSSSKKVTSLTANFTPNDVGLPVSGTNIDSGTTIATVVSSQEITLSKNSTGAGTADLAIGTDAYGLIIAGVPDATSLAVQITETEALRSENRFADVIRGLQVYGAKVFEPKALASVALTIS